MKILQRRTVSTYIGRGMIVCLLCLTYFVSHAQRCTIKTNKVKENARTHLPTIYDFGGSTFVACKTGVITNVSFKVTSESVAQPNAMLFIENGIGIGVIEAGSQTYADYVQNIAIPGNGKTATVTLSTPFPVKEGETYTWYVQKDQNAKALILAGGLAPENGFEGGSAWYNNLYYRDMDNMFSVRIK